MANWDAGMTSGSIATIPGDPPTALIHHIPKPLAGREVAGETTLKGKETVKVGSAEVASEMGAYAETESTP